jgi:hypothetical protein
MNIIRYAIRKEDLHNLLHAIGVLRPSEHLIAVNNVDLVDSSHDAVVVTVSERGLHSKPEDIAVWTDKELQQRYVELSVLEDAAARQLQIIVEEIAQLKSERDKRSMSAELSDDGIPGAVEMVIREQLRALLGGMDTTSDDDHPIP